MKKLLVLFLLCLVPFSAWAGMGSFLILKGTYLYESPERTGKRLLTRHKNAYEVLQMQEMKKGVVMFLLKFEDQTSQVNGSGFVMASDEELQANGAGMVKVYTHVPDKLSNLNLYLEVPSTQILFTGKQEKSREFPHLTWREVNYKATQAASLWVPEWAGIYRADKDNLWLVETYKKALKARVRGKKLGSLLMGLVEPGFSMEEVRLALGNPAKESTNDKPNQVEWIYPERKVVFEKNKVLQVL